MNQSSAASSTLSRKSGLLILITLFFTAPSLYAKNLYVSPSGTQNSSCSSAQPCRQIRSALALVNPGDTVLVANGNYLGFTMRSTSGTASQPITIQAAGNNAVILPTTDRPNFENRDNIFITFSNYVVIDGLNTFNAPRSGMRVDTSHNVTVRNGTFGDNYKWGIFTNHCNNILLEGNTTYGSEDEHGIYFSNSADNPTIRYNRIFDNNANGIHMNGDLSAGGASGVAGDGVISGARIEGNIIYNNGTGGGGGINMDGVQSSVITNNMLYQNHASGIIAYRIDGGQGPRNLTIAYNTVDMASDGRYALQVSQTTGPIAIHNNILGTRSTRRGGLAYGTTVDVPNVTSSHNIFVGNPIVAFNDWSILKSLSQWQAENPQNEAGSFESSNSALFVNPDAAALAQRDYHLKAGAPALNKGIAVTGISIDIDKQSRGAPSDIGADESGGSPNPPPDPPADPPPSNHQGNAIPAILLLLDD